MAIQSIYDMGSGPTAPSVQPAGGGPAWLPPGATLDPDGTIHMPDGTIMAVPPGYTRDPNTGNVVANGGVPSTTVTPGGGNQNLTNLGITPGPHSIDLTNPTGTGNQSPTAQLNNFLLKYPGNPQAAIDAWNAAGDPGGLQPAWDPSSQTIGITGGYLVMPGTGANSGTDWQMVPSAGGAGGNGPGGYGTTPIDPSYLTPFGSQSGLNAIGNNPPQFQSPGGFTAPTAAEAAATPGYQFALGQAVNTVQNGAAAAGLINSGGTVYDLAQLGANFADQNYNNLFNQDFSIWNQNWNNAIAGNAAQLTDYQNARDTYYANQTNPFNKGLNVAQLGANTATTAG